ncbi:MAG: hypothetical protein J7623_16550 [Chitinophaga sp.]|uniref:hypothetical protein n=1 Tax=Chitinophaga sp. TaxID=1869181 RepID=UPI001B2E29E2|nr:hypothetical protein [Chitinophaga sp.]MBO9730252.1 hypothetical protein [Chitinophaga sp.]
MKTAANIWGIKEFEEAGPHCPIIPAHLPWYKKAFLALFRFGVCPLCITMSIAYSLRRMTRPKQSEHKNPS